MENNVEGTRGPADIFPQPMPGCDELDQALAMLRRVQDRRTSVALLCVGLGTRTPGSASCAALCSALRANVRARDPICWLGAAGFAVLLLGATPDGAESAARRLSTVLRTHVAVVRMERDEPLPTILKRLAMPRGAA